MISYFVIGVIVGVAARPVLSGFAALRRRSLSVASAPLDPFAATPGLPAPPPRSSGWLGDDLPVAAPPARSIPVRWVSDLPSVDADPTPPSGITRPRLSLRRRPTVAVDYEFPF